MSSADWHPPVSVGSTGRGACAALRADDDARGGKSRKDGPAECCSRGASCTSDQTPFEGMLEMSVEDPSMRFNVSPGSLWDTGGAFSAGGRGMSFV